MQALGGAKNHMVVMPDADLEQATDALMGAAYGSAGERCMAISVAVAVGGVGDALVERLAPRVAGAEGRAGHRPGGRDGAAGDARSTSTRCAATSMPASREGAELVVDGRDLRLQGTRTASFSAAACSTT